MKTKETESKNPRPRLSRVARDSRDSGDSRVARDFPDSRVSPDSSFTGETRDPGRAKIALPGFEKTKTPDLRSLGESLRALATMGGTDLLLNTDDVPRAKVKGIWESVSERIVRSGELEELLRETSGNASAASIVRSGKDLDFAFETDDRRRGREDLLRFRANASAIRSSDLGTGISLNVRLINARPPTTEESGVREKDLLENIFPQNGLVLVTGVMGSGKSTFLASLFRKMVETGGRHIVTYESPIEYDLGTLKNDPDDLSPPEKNQRRDPSPAEQSEIPRHSPSFKHAVRSLARRSCDVVLVGEARDKSTMRGVLAASALGAAVYTTLHTRSVRETPGRILNMFPQKERDSVKSVLFSVLRVMVQQRIYPSLDGGRLAVREYLTLDKNILETLMETDPKKLPRVLERFTREKGVSLVSALEREIKNGRIDPSHLRALKKERGED
jgi:defect-in-organelle-trafficking protein DotB